MKKIIALMLFICITAFGQNVQIKSLPSWTEGVGLHDNDYIAMSSGVNGKTYRYKLNLLGSGGSSDLLSETNAWTGANDFTLTLKAPSSLSSATARGIGYSGGLFSWVENNQVKTGADRGWVISYVTTNGYAGDLSAYSTLAGNNTFTGTNIFTTALSIGSGVNTGTFILPFYSIGSSSPAVGSAYIDVTNGELNIHNGTTWLKFLEETAITTLAQTGASLPITGTQNNIDSDLHWIGGGIDLQGASQFRLPDFGSITASEGNMAFSDNGILYYKSDLSVEILYNSTKVQELIDNMLSYNTPAFKTLATETLDFTNNNYCAGIYGANGTQNIEISNYQAGWVAFHVHSQEIVNVVIGTVALPTATIKWAGGVPDFSDGRYYKVVIEFHSSTIAFGAYTWHE